MASREDEDEVHETELVHQPSRPLLTKTELAMETIRGIEDQMLRDALTVMNDVNRQWDIDKDHDFELGGYPSEWRDELEDDETALRRRARIAKAAWEPVKSAPIGLIMTQRFVAGVIKARATEKSGPRTLNVGTVNLGVPESVYSLLEVDDEK